MGGPTALCEVTSQPDMMDINTFNSGLIEEHIEI